jgi:PKD repeat protein
MKKQSFIQTIFLASVLFLTDQLSGYGQIIHQESFDAITFPPSGWTTTGNLWVRRTVGTNPTCNPHSGAAMARFSSNNQMPGTSEIFILPAADYSGRNTSTPTFSMWVYRDNSSTAGDSISILVNTTASLAGAVRIGGVARSRFFVLPVNETANGWYRYTFSVPAAFNTATNYIILNGVARGGGNIYIDDVEWTEYPVACNLPLNAGNIIASDTLICNGGGIASLQIDGSSVTDGGLTFQWQTAPSTSGPWTNFGANANTTKTDTLTSAAWFRCYITCSAGGTDTSNIVFINISPNPTPTVIVTPTTSLHCSAAAPVLLTASGAATYVWSPTLPANASGDSAFASPSSNTVYTVIGYDSTGCAASATATVNFANSPSVTASSSLDTICSGQTVALNAALTGPGAGITFLWQPGNLAGAVRNVTPSATTTYVVTATQNQTGCTGKDSVEIFVYQSPVAGFTFTQNNLTFNFTDTTSGAISWLWNFGDGSTDTTQNPSHTYASSGQYNVSLTVNNGNCSSTIQIPFSVVSVRNLFGNGSTVSMSPNPATSNVTIQFEYPASSAILSVENLIGQQALNKTLQPLNNMLFRDQITVAGWAKGLYLLKIKAGNDFTVIPLIVN